MAMRTYFVAQCDFCDEHSVAFHAGLYDKQMAWDQLKKEGWTRGNKRPQMGMTYKCPTCNTPAVQA